MDLNVLLGDSIYTAVLFWVSVAGAASLLLATFFAIFYHRFFYNRFIQPTFNNSYNPKCSVILPCKGIPHNFEQNIASFLDLDYDNYEVIYTVESEDDPAVMPIKKLVEQDERASLVVAGYSTTCSQKNYNMIKAIQKADNPDVYVFADSDIKLYPAWLTELVRPLSRKDITVTSGFRWLYSTTGKLAEQTNVYQNIIIYVLFTFASFVQNIGLWGGSMAMRKKDYEDLDVEKFWLKTVVDDSSLSKLIMKNSKKAVMVTPCVVPTDDALKSIKHSTAWFERQMMFLKSYQRLQWYIAILLALVIIGVYVWIPVALVISLLTSRTFLGLGGAGSLILFFGIMSTTLIYPVLGKFPAFIRFVLYQPISLFTILHAIMKTTATNTVLWSGITYKLNYRGKVTSVER